MAMSDKDRVLADLAERLRQIAGASRTYDAREPVYAPWPATLDARIIAALEAFAPGGPFSHQRAAIDLALAGKNVCLATETASGKTLAYLVPIASAVAVDSASRALIIYPTKALAWDQTENISRMAGALGEHGLTLTAAKYDGDTPDDEKKAIRADQPSIILTNPDELHYGMLRAPARWGKLLKHLRYVVLDELHAYAGFFGSNVALVLRRLRQLCRAHGSDPTFIAASATIENAGRHAAALTGAEFIVIAESGAGSGHREVFLISPPLDPTDIVVGLASAQTLSGLQSIVFGNARVTVEQLGDQIRRRVGPLVATYRGGYLARERRETHHALKEGAIRCVVSTNALELGIDIGDLDVAILHGHPGTNAAVWQRIGRVGRHHDRRSLGVVVTSAEAVDRYYARNPDEFFASRGRPERVVVTPGNAELLRRHLRCAVLEADGGSVALDLFPPEASMVLPTLTPPPSPYRAYAEAEIRFIRPSYEVRDVESDQVVDSIDGNVAHREAHWKAVYMHGAGRYRIGGRPKGKARIECKPETVAGRRTIPDVETDAELVELRASFDFSVTGRPVMPFLWGVIHFTDVTTGYRESTEEIPNLRQRTLSHPQGIDLTSDGFALVLGPELNQRLASIDRLAPLQVLHGLGHLLVNALAERGVAGQSDLVEYALEYTAELDGPTLYIGEAFKGGLGFAKELFDNLETYLVAAHDRVKRCPCTEDAGCPACILLKQRCPQKNIAMHKGYVRDFLPEPVDRLRPQQLSRTRTAQGRFVRDAAVGQGDPHLRTHLPRGRQELRAWPDLVLEH